MSEIMTAKNLSLWYGDNKALKDINIAIPEKSITALIGPSGCGKSTFLKTLNRMNDLIPIVKITGEVCYNGRNIFDKDVDVNELRRDVGMVFQKPNPFPMSIYYNKNEEFNLTYNVDWDESKFEFVMEKFKILIAALNKIGKLHDELENEENRKMMLTLQELEIWETYIRPFEPFEVELSVIGELYFRSEYDELSDEENELLERHHEWYEAESLKRLPVLNRSPRYVINCAERYERLVAIKAPQSVLNVEACCLAEEMVLYYYCK
ncbi:MAG: ATP-binding cassette domain-containing protein [Ruminococcaceae bacterium]|nr:ATP-binding cassette domain-containing protein [Oscillospiraceae bacterium]